jgi:hypothetical protein
MAKIPGIKIPGIKFAGPRLNGKAKVAGGSVKRGHLVTFGAVTVTATRPHPDIVSKNVLAGQSALERVAKKLAKPGVTIRSAKGVPLYYVDENHPKVIVRELDGKREQGALRNGKFEPRR